MEVGIKGYHEIIVEESMLASCVGSGLVDVFSTPMMIAYMEKTAAESIAPLLGEETTTVGAWLEVNHLAATPVGLKVTFETEVIEIDGKVITFVIEAFDEKEKIGQGKHRRVIVNKEKFMKRSQEKKA